MITVSRRVRRSRDRAGDPLDGLVNLFDLGIVLSVGFLLAALSALHLAGTLGGSSSPGQVTAPDGSQVSPVPSDGRTVVGNGTQVGSVYRLDDGRLVYVIPPDSPGPSSDATP